MRILIFLTARLHLRHLCGPKVTSGLVAECLDALSALASLNRVTLAWVPGHRAFLVMRKLTSLLDASAMPLLGPEPALGIPKCLLREAIKNWTEMQHLTG